MLLSDLGADVQKIEPLQQDERRRGMGPYVHDVSSYFFSVNRGKKSLLIDLKAEGAQEIILALIRDSDVLTENFSPGTMDRLGFGYEALNKRNPGIVYGSINFAVTSPLPISSSNAALTLAAIISFLSSIIFFKIIFCFNENNWA